jgi:predicted AlkP superfamily pyrophosphatase or phosphodiesterase
MKLAIALAALAGLGGPAFARPAKERMMVMISLDGFPAYALDDPKLPIPTLRRLMRNGASARMATVNPTVTWPNHTSIVTGVRGDEHGLLANEPYRGPAHGRR